MQHRPWNRWRAFAELQERGFIDRMTKRAVQPKDPARYRMASDVVGLRCHRRTSEQEVLELRPRNTNRGIKVFRHGIKSKPACGMKTSKTASRCPRSRVVMRGPRGQAGLHRLYASVRPRRRVGGGRLRRDASLCRRRVSWRPIEARLPNAGFDSLAASVHLVGSIIRVQDKEIAEGLAA